VPCFDGSLAHTSSFGKPPLKDDPWRLTEKEIRDIEDEVLRTIQQ
jgi:hypothetical protein